MIFPTFCILHTHWDCVFIMITNRWNLRKQYETVWFYAFTLLFLLCSYMHAPTYAVNLKPKFKKAPTKLTGNKVLFTVSPQRGWHKNRKRKLWPICAMRNHFSLWWFFFRFVFHFLFSVFLLRHERKLLSFSLKNDEKAWHVLLLMLKEKTMIKMDGCVCHDARRFSKAFLFNFSFAQKTLRKCIISGNSFSSLFY